ncbi:MAG: hypothetical protein ABI665_15145 [Vicinamibacterales bacterium]
MSDTDLTDTPKRPRRVRREPAGTGGSVGPATDRHNVAVVDPTKNVLDLVDSSIARIDDIGDLRMVVFTAEIRHIRETMALRAEHAKDIAAAESGRLNSIRQVDREEVAKTAAAANLAVAALAKQTTDLATTLQNQVLTTANAAETRRSADMAEIGKRVSALELSSSEGKGKVSVSDPQMEKLTQLVETLARSQATGVGKTEGLSQGVGLLLGAVTLIGALLGIGGLVFAWVERPQAAATAPASVIYVPSPAGTLLPTTPPAQAPR